MKFIIDRFDGKKSYQQTYTVEKKDIETKTLLGFFLYIK